MNETSPAPIESATMSREIAYSKALANLKEATQAGHLAWKRTYSSFYHDVWYNADLTFTPENHEEMKHTFTCRFHYYIPSKRLRREVNWGRVESAFWMESNNFGLGAAVGTKEYYLLTEFIASLFEAEKRLLEKERIATKELCRALKQESFYPDENACLFDTDMTMIRFLLEETRLGKIHWHKKGMRDRRRFLATVVENEVGKKFEIHIKALRFFMTNRDKWSRIETPLFMVLEIPGRKIPFIMGSEGYCLLEEIVAAAKGRDIDRISIQNTLTFLRQYTGEKDKCSPDKDRSRTYYESIDRVLELLMELSESEIIQWKEIDGSYYVGYLSGKSSREKKILEFERHWLHSSNQPGNDPLVLEAKISGKSFFAFWNVGYGKHLSTLVELLWKRKRKDDDAWEDHIPFEKHVKYMRQKLFPKEQR